MLASQLAETIPLVIGIDSSSAQVVLASARFDGTPGLRFVPGNALSRRVPKEPFDFVVCVAALHHMDLDAGLRRLRELTAPGGTLVVIGLARIVSPVDRLLSILVTPFAHITRAKRGWYDHGAPMDDPHDSLATIRLAARNILPGALVRRRLYWRYSLEWINA
jgi:SAM-dependent methyltransferase